MSDFSRGFISFTNFHILHLFSVRGYQFVALAMNINDLNIFIRFQVLTQLGDINIHRPCIEIVVINPNRLQCVITL